MFLLAAEMMGLSILQWIIVAIAIAGAVGILFVVCRVAGVTIPEWVIHILWIVAVVVVAILAIGFIGRVAGLM